LISPLADAKLSVALIARLYVDANKWTEADTQVPALAKVLEDAAAAIGRTADDLEAATTPAH